MLVKTLKRYLQLKSWRFKHIAETFIDKDSYFVSGIGGIKRIADIISLIVQGLWT